MARPKSPPALARQRWYRGTDVPMSAIRKCARQVAERFQPDKIILFGSYAYGTPHADSDVDILVVMPARNPLDSAFKIHWAIKPPFPLDIIVTRQRTWIGDSSRETRFCARWWRKARSFMKPMAADWVRKAEASRAEFRTSDFVLR
jgi:predicted nucleotidyltransferase